MTQIYIFNREKSVIIFWTQEKSVWFFQVTDVIKHAIHMIILKHEAMHFQTKL